MLTLHSPAFLQPVIGHSTVNAVNLQGLKKLYILMSGQNAKTQLQQDVYPNNKPERKRRLIFLCVPLA